MFNNDHVRRQDRLLDEEETLRLLQEGEYGFLSTARNTGTEGQVPVGGYGVPLNYVLEGRTIYFHCAPEGEKLRNIRQYPHATFSVVGRTRIIPAGFTTAYESAMAQGTVSEITCEDEKIAALSLLINKYSPEYKESGMKYIKASLARTTILRFDILRLSGKTKKEPGRDVSK